MLCEGFRQVWAETCVGKVRYRLYLDPNMAETEEPAVQHASQGNLGTLMCAEVPTHYYTNG